MVRSEKLTPKQFNNLINHESGLLGVSETSSDMRDLIKRQASEIPAAEAVELFCYQTRKWIGAFAAALGGLETLVFAGGIGENAGEVRARVCRGLQFLGIELDEARNDANAPVISTVSGRVTVRVVRTDEELMIARAVCRLRCRKTRPNRVGQTRGAAMGELPPSEPLRKMNAYLRAGSSVRDRANVHEGEHGTRKLVGYSSSFARI